MNTNVVVLEGGLTRDPEIRDAGASQVANFGIGVRRRIKDGDTWKDGPSSYFDIQAWGWIAERVMQLSKGDQVIVVGALEFNQYEKEGVKKNVIRVNANAVGRQLPKPGEKPAKVDDGDIPF